MAAILIVVSGCGRGEHRLFPKFNQGEMLPIRAAALKPNVPAYRPKTGWKLLSGLSLLRSSIDVSSDRTLAVVWGERAFGAEARKSCWLIDLQTAEIKDLLSESNDSVAAIVRDPKRVTFSPDGRHLLVSAQDGETACILDLSTGKTVIINDLEHSDVLWVGDRLLFSHGPVATKIYDLTGRLQAQPKVDGCILASDPTGTKLLVDYPDLAVVDPEGKVLRKLSDNACDKEVPLLSRSGNWAGIFCNEKDEWAYSVVSTTTDEILRLRRPWGATFALTDNGDSIFLVGGGSSTFGAVMTGGQRVEASTADIVFWPKDDDPWKSTKGAPEGPTFNDTVWNRMPLGKSQIIAKKAMALTLLGNEIFVVQAEGDERELKAISLPESQAKSPVSESCDSQKEP
jgi:hypothetical protein